MGKNDRGHSGKQHIAVIGSGIVGILIARELIKAGFDVTVVDKGSPEDRCSYGNAGSLSPGSVAPLGMPGVLKQVPGMLVSKTAPLRIRPTFAHKTIPWMTRFVQASSRKQVEKISHSLHALLSDSINQYSDILKSIDALDLLKQTGQLQLYRTIRQKNKDSGSWALRRKRGVEVIDVNREEIFQLEPNVGKSYAHGVFLPNEGMVVDPAKLVDVLIAAFIRDGGKIVNDSAVGFHANGSLAASVQTRLECIHADSFVIAAGAWSNELSQIAGDKVPLISQRGYHITLHGVRDAISRPTVAADRKFFVTPMSMGLRVAGTVEFDEMHAPENKIRSKALLAGLSEFLPDVRSDNITSWMGHRPCLPDSLPIIGTGSRLKNVIYAFGNGHLGLTAAPKMAKIVSAIALGGDPKIDLEPFSASRFNSRANDTPEDHEDNVPPIIAPFL